MQECQVLFEDFLKVLMGNNPKLLTLLISHPCNDAVSYKASFKTGETEYYTRFKFDMWTGSEEFDKLKPVIGSANWGEYNGPFYVRRAEVSNPADILNSKREE